MKRVLLTGDRPSGRLHLGHYVGSLKSRVCFQKEYESYIMIADVQALTDNFDNPDIVRNSVYDIAMDYLAVGIDPSISTVYIQSQIPEITELTLYYMNFVTLSRLERNPTVKAELVQKRMNTSIPVGFLCYPINQAADITIFGAEVVPVGTDQLPMVEQTNEIVRKFNNTYEVDLLKECEAYVGTTGRLPGIDGKGKASKSLGNAIFLSDTVADVKRKVNMMYTDPNHVKTSDPGRIDGNVVFAYLDAFHENEKEVADLKTRYKSGGLGDIVLKEMLLLDLEKLLAPIRERRASISREQIADMLLSGSRAARVKAADMLVKVRQTIGIDYFGS
jgi:tryptophanyl-tRNA synthetase